VSDAEVSQAIGAAFFAATADELLVELAPDLDRLRDELQRDKATHPPGVGKLGFYASADFWEKLLAVATR
jgi:hypothetical protein